MKLDRIGDFVLALGAIRAVLDRHGEANCLLVIAPAVVELAAQQFPATPWVVLPAFVRHKHAWRDWRRARALLGGVVTADLYCLRHQRWDYHELILTWIRADRRHVLEDPSVQRWVTDRRSVRVEAAPVRDLEPAGNEICRELQLHQQLLAAAWGAAGSAESLRPVLDSSPIPSGPAYAVIAPLTSTRLKDLPLATLGRLTACQGRAGVTRIRLVGAAEQRETLETWRQALMAAGWRNLEVMTPPGLSALIDLLAGAAWVLAADSAAAHLATALDRPSVFLLGGGCPGQFAPWRRSHRQVWLEQPLACFDCGWRCTQPEPYCLTQIDPMRVAEALRLVTEDAR